MSKHDDSLTELFDKNGNLIGALLTADLWSKVKPRVKDLLPAQTPQERPEPIGAWETLKEYWDFEYPIDTDVHCKICGTSTQNWEEDTPRKFRLVSANLGGLVSFKCCQCSARITKKHFKDEIKVETKAFVEEKTLNFEARYK
ncbi:hypothetical protein [Maridesulfovibrio hydrothermalis]|uniref:Uncharacterized protein n=1 Tax=Maridesulfovibrio hydrothermalis AM13 = DSM 14728 TaxID=1121451 RepID=L0RBT6_9BACT|nr:hypothetical protein [Maridesulfovibrio hydrothermalis]CCO23011.1 conserved protein of unknown function [Maridesulfovibrio hydrothermalis AM13 = DSM 14728]